MSAAAMYHEYQLQSILVYTITYVNLFLSCLEVLEYLSGLKDENNGRLLFREIKYEN